MCFVAFAADYAMAYMGVWVFYRGCVIWYNQAENCKNPREEHAMAQPILFETAGAFREWLMENAQTSGGIWLLFGKRGGPRTLTAQQALEEALCFGWIDGQMRRVDDTSYVKYFAPRTPTTAWSKRNIALVDGLTAAGRMHALGLARVQADRQAGRFAPKARTQITPEAIAAFEAKIKGHEPAYTNLMAMPPSVHKTYTGYSLDVKSEAAAQKRLEKIIDRLNRNLPPM